MRLVYWYFTNKQRSKLKIHQWKQNPCEKSRLMIGALNSILGIVSLQDQNPFHDYLPLFLF